MDGKPNCRSSVDGTLHCANLSGFKPYQYIWDYKIFVDRFHKLVNSKLSLSNKTFHFFSFSFIKKRKAPSLMQNSLQLLLFAYNFELRKILKYEIHNRCNFTKLSHAGSKAVELQQIHEHLTKSKLSLKAN